MATITLKNIPEALHETLKQRAASHRRNLNSEAIDCLERAVRGKPFDVPSFLATVFDAFAPQLPGRLTMHFFGAHVKLAGHDRRQFQSNRLPAFAGAKRGRC